MFRTLIGVTSKVVSTGSSGPLRSPVRNTHATFSRDTLSGVIWASGEKRVPNCVRP